MGRLLYQMIPNPPDLRHGPVTPFGYYYGMKQMISRRRFKQSESLKDRFISEVRRLCEEAKTLSRREEGETKERHLAQRPEIAAWPPSRRPAAAEVILKLH
jgi:hypothetical protein